MCEILFLGMISANAEIDIIVTLIILVNPRSLLLRLRK